MDWDEPERQMPKAIAVGEPIASLSVDELQRHITALEARFRVRHTRGGRLVA